MFEPEMEHSVQIVMEHVLTRQQFEAIKALQESGLYGRSFADVLVGLVGEAIRTEMFRMAGDSKGRG